MAKLDWRIKDNVHAFYRFSYEQNHNVKGFIANSFSPFNNVNNTPVHAAGLDFNTGTSRTPSVLVSPNFAMELLMRPVQRL